MPTEKERQGILKVFFENNLDTVDSDVSNQIECPGVTFRIFKDTAADQFILLCKQGADDWQKVNDGQKDEFIGLLGKKLIFEVGETENAEYLQACLDAGASLKDGNADGNTPLHLAAIRNEVGACEFLVEKGADIFAVDERGVTALGISPEGEARDFLREKREELCEHYYDQFSPTGEKKNEVLKAFYESLRGVATGEVFEFYDRDRFRYLIRKNGEEYSIYDLNNEGVEIEISPWEIGYALNDLGKTAIFESLNTTNKKLFEACLNVGVSANEKDGDGYSALFHAARAGNSELCELLIENGANVSAANDFGIDALIVAAKVGHEEVCKLLIEKGADILRMDKSGKTAASYSQRNGEILDLLRLKQKERYEENRGVELDSAKTTEILSAFYVNLGGVTANDESKDFLHQNGREYLIVKAGNEFKLQETNGADLEDWESSYVLRTFGRNLNKGDGTGISKFFEAARAGGESKFIKACLDCGISVDEKDDKGKTALFYARARDDKDTIKALSDASAEKHKTTTVEDRETQSLLGAFFATKKGLTEKDFDVAEGKYSIKERTAETDGRKTFFIEVEEGADNRELLGNEINLAIGDLGRSLIFDAAKSGNTELYKACIKAGASNDDADGEGNRPLTYAKMNGESRKIVHSIAGITKDPTTGGLKKPRDKFRELAIAVREAYIANKEKGGFEEIIQGVIDSFGVRHSGDFTVDGLLASDMIAFIKDIDIEKTQTQAQGETLFQLLSKKPDSEDGSGLKVQELIKGKSLEETKPDNDGRRKSFYRQLLISCLEDGHHFLSEEHTENIRSLIAKNAQEKVSTKLGKSAGDFALNSVDKDSVVDLYMRARFEELRKREGLKDDLTYEAFSENLGKVVKINSGRDVELHQTKIKKAREELERLEEELTRNKHDVELALISNAEAMALATLDGYQKTKEGTKESRYESFIKEKEGTWPNLTTPENLEEELAKKFANELLAEERAKPDSWKDREAKIATQKTVIKELENYEKNNSLDWNENNRAISALLGSTSKKKKNKDKDYIAHGDLRIALDMIRGGIEFTPAEIIKQRDLRQSGAAITLGRVFKGFSSRLNELDAKKFPSKLGDSLDKISKLQLSEAEENFELKCTISKEEFFRDYANSAIPQVLGTSIKNSNTGLAIHYFSGASGFSEFTNQVAEANRKERTDEGNKVSIAHIKDMPNGDRPDKESFCVAVLGDNGATKIFSGEIKEISERSEELYKENLKFLTNQRGLEAAIEVITNARNALLPKALKENNEEIQKKLKEKSIKKGEVSEIIDEESKSLRKELSDTLAKLRGCLMGCEFEKSDLPERTTEKGIKLKNRLKEFWESPEGKGFKVALELREEYNIRTLDPKYLKVVKSLLEDGYSDEEMRGMARKMTSRQMQGEIAANVKSSMEDGKYKFNLSGLEIAQAVAAYQNKDSASFNLGKKGKTGFENLLAEEMPASAYKGISVFRPRGKDNIATVIFNGDKGDDTMYLTLPDTQQCYVRVSRCDYDGNFSVWRQGKKVNEEHKKGDLIIDTGVVFHKEENGTYVTIPYGKLDSMSYGQGVKKAALDFEIKAISVNEGQCLSSAMLYNGREISLDLVAKTLPIQKVDSHKPQEKPKSPDVVFKKLGQEILATDLVIKIGENAKLIISEDGSVKIVTALDKDPFKQEYLTADEEFKKALNNAVMALSEQEVEKFKKDFSKHFSIEKTPEDLNALIEKLSETEPASSAVKNASKKYAVINSFKGFDLVVPVKLEGSGTSKAVNPDFSSPEIQFEEKGEGETKGELKRMTLDAPGANEIICSSADRKFLLNFFSEKEMSGKGVKEFLEERGIYERLCEKMKGRCEKASVTVGFQEVKEDGTLNYETHYKSVGELEAKTFVYDSESLLTGAKEVGSLAAKVKPTFRAALLSGLSGTFTKGERGRIIVNPTSSGRGA
jgi:ankyrin repeat protein